MRRLVMKRIFISVVMATVLCTNVSAVSYYKTVEEGLVGLGKSIEAINVPVIGKLLPFAVIGASLKECPLQTLAVLAGLLGYVLAHNEMVQDRIYQSGLLDTLGFKRSKQVSRDIVDDTLFYFEGDDSDDAEDDDLAGDELLFSEDDKGNNKKRSGKSALAAL
jgi:hypothetical protein